MVAAATRSGAKLLPEIDFRASDCGFSAFTSSDVKEQSTLMSIPYSAIMTPRRAMGTELGEQFCQQVALDTSSGIPPLPVRAVLYLVLAAERLAPTHSLWGPYAQSIPAEQDAAILWNDAQLAWIAGSNAHPNILHRQHCARELYAGVQGAAQRMKQRLGGACSLDPALLTWDVFMWAHASFMSRAFPLKVAGEVDDPAHPPPGFSDEGPLGSAFPPGALLPLMDTLNHTPNVPITWQCDKDCLRFVLQCPLPGGAEVMNNYGAKGDEELLVGYGFVLSKGVQGGYMNPHDRIALRLGMAGGQLPAQAAHLLRRCHLDGRYEVGIEGSPPAGLLLHLALVLLADEEDCVQAGSFECLQGLSSAAAAWETMRAQSGPTFVRNVFQRLFLMIQAKLASFPSDTQVPESAENDSGITGPTKGVQGGLITLETLCSRRAGYRAQLARRYLGTQRLLLQGALECAQGGYMSSAREVLAGMQAAQQALMDAAGTQGATTSATQPHIEQTEVVLCEDSNIQTSLAAEIGAGKGAVLASKPTVRADGQCVLAVFPLKYCVVADPAACAQLVPSLHALQDELSDVSLLALQLLGLALHHGRHSTAPAILRAWAQRVSHAFSFTLERAVPGSAEDPSSPLHRIASHSALLRAPRHTPAQDLPDEGRARQLREEALLQYAAVAKPLVRALVRAPLAGGPTGGQKRLREGVAASSVPSKPRPGKELFVNACLAVEELSRVVALGLSDALRVLVPLVCTPTVHDDSGNMWPLHSYARFAESTQSVEIVAVLPDAAVVSTAAQVLLLTNPQVV